MPKSGSNHTKSASGQWVWNVGWNETRKNRVAMSFNRHEVHNLQL